ncbi:MAG: aminotransferase class V-fold PLP-dependent enzyme [Sulfobacillus sp.]
MDLRQDFPLLVTPEGKQLTYLDSAATAQKPELVLQTLDHYYRYDNANVYRGVYSLAARATAAFEQAREKVASFIHAEPDEVIFTSGTTESVNAVAWAWARAELKPGDEILTSEAEHHSNLVPWQEAARATGAKLTFVPLDEDKLVTTEAVLAAITPRTKIVALAQVSNVLGNLPLNVAAISDAAHRVGAVVIVDGAQSVPHMPIDVHAMGADFVAFSGHKMMGPTGIGVLYGRRQMLAVMAPFHFGGEMISHVDAQSSTYKDAPQKFEGGTPPIAQAIGLGAACDYLERLDMAEVMAHDRTLGEQAASRLRRVPGVTVYGPGEGRMGVVSFNLEDVHPHDVATALDQQGICVRAGHHCCQPLMRQLGVAATVRASFYAYNTEADIDKLAAGVMSTMEFFHHVAH